MLKERAGAKIADVKEGLSGAAKTVQEKMGKRDVGSALLSLALGVHAIVSFAIGITLLARPGLLLGSKLSLTSATTSEIVRTLACLVCNNVL